MSMVSDARLLSHPVHEYADHNVISTDSLSVPATARDANMDANLEVATGEDALAPAALTTAPALPSDNEQTTSQEIPFTPQSVPAVSADIPPVGLAAPISLDPSADMHLGAHYPAIDAVIDNDVHVAPQEQRLSAFARLRFRDGSYYMHTYQIILGRNVELAQKDMHRLHKAQKLREAGDDAAAEAVLRGKKRKRRGPARSVVSASGGIVKVPAASLPIEYQHRRQSVASHSLSSSSRPQSGSGREESPEHAPQEVLMQTFDEVPEHLDSFVPEDPNDCPLVPIHPQHIEELAGVKGPKGISREHAKIFYNFDRGGFDLLVLSRNGLFHEGKHYGKDKVVQLDHGEKIEIGLVEIKFFLPDVALTEEQRARQESTSRPISFSFENGQGELESEEQLEDSASEDVSINPKHVFHMPMDYDSDEEGIAEEEDEDEDDEADLPSTPEPRPKKRKQTVRIKLKKAAPSAPPVKEAKRGNKRKAPEPSPPEPPAKKPKSKPKEAQKELPKEKAKAAVKEPAKEPSKEKPEASKEPKSASPVQAKKAAPLTDVRPDFDDIDFDGIITAEMVQRHKLSEALIGQPLEKRKGPGRPPKDGVMSKRQRSQLLKLGKEMERAKAAGEEPPQVALAISKPKTPRPRKDSNPDGDEEDVKESIEKTDGEGASGDRKQARLNKPARDPSPPMRIEDYTEEQLQRPSANYVVLIHEAISSAKSGQMNLQQIYSYIERHYPWYKFKTTTSGWQSSVRHNLGQHEAFMKGDKEGKGYNWKINPAVSIEKERRKRQVSPPQANQTQRPYYPPANGYPAPYGQPGGNYYPGMPPQGHPPNGVPPPTVTQPRLPPSLARSATTAAAPPSSTAPNPSPYASPWAGGKSAGSPANPGPPSYPPPQSQTPPVTSAPTYGVLYPTPSSQVAGYAAASPYAQHGPAPGTSPYGNTPARPYTPYATAGAPSISAQASTGPPPQTSAQGSGQTASASQGSHGAHASGRYPAGTNQSLVSQLEAFRDAYLRSMPKSEKAIDAAIQAFIQRDPQAKLGDTEQHLLNAIKNIPTIQALDSTRQPTSSAGEAKVKIGANGDAVPVPPQNPMPDAEHVQSQVASTAAAIAASDAAVEAATSLPAVSPTPTAGPSTTTSIPVPASSLPQAFAPNVTGVATDAGAPLKSDAKPMLEQVTQASRPSVEPLTPVPGSPAMPNGPSSIKKEVLEKQLQDAIAGAKDLDQKAQDPSTTEAPPPEQT
ncbi:hypothetical protein BDV96DRAFT_567541 [Lophiotrema nucula]|uniref:Fork-head domain-containing protein n=1 Tax=Lophiotrema nucula TaxID=690887 RepID=A0A6A5ZIS0_9PLEO|nr:hypothetical protein BDV96DRAFT_567541 [Lophiotrema nucula]